MKAEITSIQRPATMTICPYCRSSTTGSEETVALSCAAIAVERWRAFCTLDMSYLLDGNALLSKSPDCLIVRPIFVVLRLEVFWRGWEIYLKEISSPQIFEFGEF